MSIFSNTTGAETNRLFKNHFLAVARRATSPLFRAVVCAAGSLAFNLAADTTNVIFSDNFETGTMAKWTLTAANPLDPSTVTNAVPPSPVGQWSAYMNTSADRMHHNIIGDNGGSELSGHTVLTSWIYDASGTASRVFNEVRGHSGGSGLPNGGTVVSGTLAQLLAIGKYNTVTLPGEVFSGTKYQGRVTFGANAGWFNLNAPGSPNRSTGWHRFDLERMSDGTTINFYVDGILSRTITGATAEPWDTAILGPGLGTTVGDAYIDGLSVSTIVSNPPPPPPPEIRFASNGLPPPDAVYVSPEQFHAAYANGIIISNISHRKFTQSHPPPPLGGTIVHNFGSAVEFDQPSGGGTAVVARAVASANCSVRVTHSSDAGGTENYDTEMLQLDISGGSLPAGAMIRESPTLQSLGKTTIRQVQDGYMISSFFDIFTEISLDGGANWSPALQPAHVEVRVDPTSIPPIVAPSNLLPPRNDLYISPALFHALFANGIVIKDIRHSFFTQSLPPPPPGVTQTHQFDSQVDYQISTDGGLTFRPGRAPAATAVSIRHRATDGGVQTYDTEMLSLNLQGGDLLPGMMLRESPTKRSLGGTAVTPNADGTARIGSFFDVFTEISLDGGANWMPAQEAARVTLVCETPEVPKPSPNLPPPDGQYVSPAQYHAAYAAGIIIRNVSHNRFTQSQPPPPPGGTQTHSFGSQIQLEISMDGGNTFNPASAPANVSARVTSSVDSGPTRFFDTEMLALSIQGGSLPAGVMIRESPSKASLGRTSIRQVNDPATGIWDYISSFFDIFTELSLDGGVTWSPATTAPIHMGLVTVVGPPITISCPASLTVNATGPAGAVVNYGSALAFGGCNPAPTVNCNPPSGSTFPIGTTTVTCVASDSCGGSATCAFTVTVRKPKPGFFPNPVLPPPNGVYISPALYHQLYANGIIIRDIKHRRFTQGQPPPPPGQVQTHQFGSVVELEHSMDGGATFQKVAAPASCTVRVTPSAAINPASIGTQTFDTEMLALDIAGGSLPAGVMLRESPTRASTGQTTVRQVGGGFMIDSFFDVFTEISLDGGANWSPAQGAAHVELRPDVALVTPIPASTRLLPPPNDVYISPAQFHILAAQGIVIRDVRHSFFTHSMLPPPAGSKQVHQFDSQVDMMLSQDNGQTFRAVRAPAAVAVEVEAVGSADSGLYDTEMLSLDIRGGDLPPGVMIRESPTEPSRGSVSITGDPDFDLLRIGSFFDIFVEVSLDGGQNWSPAQAPAHVELICDAPAQPFPSPNLPPPDGQYISPQKFHALYAQGIIISNVSHRRFTQSTPPPPPGGTQVHNFNSDIDMMVSMNGGQTWSQVQAPAAVSVRVTSSVDEGSTRFFDTEMLSLNIQGGGLPAGVMVRESPSKASLGRTSIRMVNDPATGIWDYISSFFDIFTEVSLNGGVTWLPALTPPVHMVLAPPCIVLIACPADITAYTFSPAGRTVTFAPTVGPVDTCNAPVTSSCSPASGSVFPVGMTTVTCTASSANGTATCSFKVTVIRRVLTPRWFPRALLPPPEGEYISPQRWHQLYANGIIISNVSHRRFLQSFPAPAPGTTETHTFGSEVAGEISLDGGQTFLPLVGMGSADVTVRVTHAGTVGSTQTYDTEMLSLTLMTTNGLKLRESPSKASLGRTTVTPNPGGGFVIDSFFDVFTEISLDGGATWSPASDSVPVELRTDAQTVAPITASTRLLPPPNDLYVSPQQYHLLLAQGIQIRNVRHKFFTQSLPPPEPGIRATHNFGSQVDMELSTDGGNTFRPMRAPADVSVSLEHRSTSPDGTQVYDTEMLQLDIHGGDLPAGTMIRESPTRISQGGTAMTTTTDGLLLIRGFFDIFTEVSLDGGQNWIPAPGPARVELICEAPPIPLPNPNLPPLEGQYISPQRWHALYAQGIIISNVSHKRFTQTFPPPPPGATETHSFGSQVECDLSMNNGQTWQHTSLPAQVTVSLREMQSSGDTRFFETEMLALNIQGGGLPAGAMIRESPTKASLGRTSIRMVNDPATGIWDYVSSFFDVFTELSVDGGQTWQPSLTAPGGVVLVPLPAVNCATITCPSNIVAWTCSPNGTTVNYTVVASNICGGTVSVSCTRPSGSIFPVGVTTVTCTATALNAAGAPVGTAECSFTVTVTVDVKPPTLVCPNDITVRTCGDREIVFYATPVATDDCDPAPAVSCLPPSGSVFPAGTTIVDCIARDACGNRTNCTFKVTVIPEPVPKLTIRILPTAPAQIQICWSTPCPGYRLQCVRGLETPILWENVTNAVTVNNGTNYCVTLPLQTNRRFYRLVRNTPQEVFSSANTLPPVGSYNSAPNEVAVFPAAPGLVNGVIARWFIHRIPSLPCPPNCPVPPCPTCPDPIILSFPTTLEVQYSLDGGQTFLNAVGQGITRVQVHGGVNGQVGPVGYLDTEMVSMDITLGGSLAGVMLRESPTRASTGKHVIRTIDGGYRIGSFFDVFLDLSLDGGQNWLPALTPVHVDYNPLVQEVAATTDTFPPNGVYLNLPTVPSHYGNGLIARGFRHIVQPPCPPFCKPPPCLFCPPDFYDIPTQLSFEVSSDGGQTFTAVGIPVQTRLSARHFEDSSDTRFFDVEILALSPMNVPPGTQVMLRESPTLASTGKTSVRTLPAPSGGYRISSFFDVFTEVSLDGGATWSSVVNPTHLEFQGSAVTP